MKKFFKKNNLKNYVYLIRLHQPAGFFLLLWPSLWGIFFSNPLFPSYSLIFIFFIGAFVMRSAGCIVNDLIDQDIDPHILRTKYRPLAADKINSKSAMIFLMILLSMALFLVFQLNILCRWIAVLGIILVFIYPFLKRFTYFPQVFLGLIFGGLPVIMGYAAVENKVTFEAFWMSATASLWPMAYDTIYAMQDIEDDRKAGVKSLAIFLGSKVLVFFEMMQIIFLVLIFLFGIFKSFSYRFDLGWGIALIIFLKQRMLIKKNHYQGAFQSHVGQGAALFIGILLEKSLFI